MPFTRAIPPAEIANRNNGEKLMDTIVHLKYMFDNVARITGNLIADITEEESMIRGEHALNHIRWQTGHLVHSDNIILSLFDEKAEDFDLYKRIFQGGTDPSDDSSAYPSMADLRDRFSEVHQKVIRRVERATDAELSKEVGSGEHKATVWQAITFLCAHAFYHSGQIAQVRKIIGRDRMFT